MNKVHSSIIRYIRDMPIEANPILKTIENMKDEQVVRRMFRNFRGRDNDARGLRLTNFGKEVMTFYFKPYEIVNKDGRKPADMELVYLDRRAKLPYYIEDNGNIVMFDPELGIKLKLADGDIRILIAMDG